MFLLSNRPGYTSVALVVKSQIKIWSATFVLLWLPIDAPAIGEFNGVWMGLETASAQGITESGVTGTIVYQVSLNRLSLFTALVGPTVELHRSGNAWVLPAPVDGRLLGVPVTIETMTLRFLGANKLAMSQTARAQGVFITGTANYDRQTCASIRAPFTSPPFNGAEDSLRCFEINVPAGALALRASTSGGTGDADLIVAYHKPDFRHLSSDADDNQEHVVLSAPEAGKWFLGVTGWENFAGVRLTVEIDLPSPPVASFSATPITGIAPLRVQFTNTSTGSITDWKWTFGDGAESRKRNPGHTYISPGRYVVKLRVLGPGGTNTTTEKTFIQVYDPFTLNPVLDLLLDKEPETR